MRLNPKPTEESKYYRNLASRCRHKWSTGSPVRAEVYKDARAVNWTFRMQKFVCKHCKDIFAKSEVECDHISPICETIHVKDLNDLIIFLRVLNVGKAGLQILCKPCHQIKTKKDLKLSTLR